MPKRSGKGAYREHQERLWRHDKRRPRRTRIEIIQDLGRSIEKDVLTFPSYTTVEQKEIPKERSGLWQVIWKHGFKIVKSLETDRLFVYDLRGEFICELELLSAYRLGVKLLNALGAFHETINRQIGDKKYTKYVLRSERSIYNRSDHQK
jgi:hypothetical protein